MRCNIASPDRFCNPLVAGENCTVHIHDTKIVAITPHHQPSACAAASPQEASRILASIMMSRSTSGYDLPQVSEDLVPSLPRTASPTCRDVIMGRGKGPESHAGNVSFLHVVAKYVTKYYGTRSRKAKKQITWDIVNYAQEHGIRFLMRAGGSDDQWEEADDEAVRTRVGQSLRYLHRQQPARFRAALTGSSSSSAATATASPPCCFSSDSLTASSLAAPQPAETQNKLYAKPSPVYPDASYSSQKLPPVASSPTVASSHQLKEVFREKNRSKSLSDHDNRIQARQQHTRSTDEDDFLNAISHLPAEVLEVNGYMHTHESEYEDEEGNIDFSGDFTSV